MRKMWKLLLRKRGVTPVISSVILTGAVIAVSFVVLSWTQYRSSAYNEQYGDAMDADIAKLKERLTFEYIFYNGAQDNLSVYLMNSGTIDGIEIKTVYIYDSSNALIEIFPNSTSPNLPLYPFQSWDKISGLDIGEEGRLVLTLSTSLEKDAYYCVKVVSVRGSTFENTFVA